MKILTVENLSKSFGGIHANRDISFDVEEGIYFRSDWT